MKEADSAGRAETRKGLTHRPQRTTRRTLPPADRHGEAPYLSHLTLIALPGLQRAAGDPLGASGRPGHVRARATESTRRIISALMSWSPCLSATPASARRIVAREADRPTATSGSSTPSEAPLPRIRAALQSDLRRPGAFVGGALGSLSLMLAYSATISRSGRNQASTSRCAPRRSQLA